MYYCSHPPGSLPHHSDCFVVQHLSAYSQVVARFVQFSSAPTKHFLGVIMAIFQLFFVQGAQEARRNVVLACLCLCHHDLGRVFRFPFQLWNFPSCVHELF